ncbi:MAG: phosphoribosylglycinamide formyltransferase [Phycisphaerales bacterium]
MHPAPLAILLSGSGRTLDNLLSAIARGELPARVAVVIASRECLGAEKARAAGLPTLIVPGRIPAAELGRLLAEHGVTPDRGWVVLAGYLKLVSIPPGFDGRVVNIHPALLPRFGGPGMHGHHVHEAVLAAGERESGCTVHLCDARFDTGPIVLQRHCPVNPGDTPEALAARVFEQECLAYPEALRRLISGAFAAPVATPRAATAPPAPSAPSPAARESWGTPTARVFIGFVLGGVLIWSGVAKLIDPIDARAFVRAVLPMLSETDAGAGVIGSAAAELLLAAWLISGFRRRDSLIAFAGLMLVFCVLLAVAAARGYQGSCGCFGSGSAAAGQGILRNVGLAVVAALGITLLPRAKASPAHAAE